MIEAAAEGKDVVWFILTAQRHKPALAIGKSDGALAVGRGGSTLARLTLVEDPLRMLKRHLRRPTPTAHAADVASGVIAAATAPRGARRPRWPHIVILEPFNAGLAVARRMMRLGAQVTVVVQPGHEQIAKSRAVKSVVAPFEPDGEPWLEAVRRVAAESEEVVVLPATDPGCELLVGASGSLPGNVRTFEHALSAHMSLMNKRDADALATRAGVAVPWTVPIADLEQLAKLDGSAPWPCVVKPVFSHLWRDRYGQERVFLVRNAERAQELLQRPLSDGVEMLICQYVPGGEEHLEEATVVRLADGSYPVQWGCRKLRQYPRGFGAATVVESADVPQAMELAMRVLDEAGFVGVANVETKRHAETGENLFLEVNVRIPGHWGLGDASGAEGSERLIAAMVGRELTAAPPIRPGVRAVFPELDRKVVLPMLAEAPPLKRPALALKLVSAYRHTREVGMFDPRDPGPALAMLAGMVRRRLSALLARLRPQPRGKALSR